MKKLIVVPARGGSKGIPGKNIYPLCGKPLLEYTLDLIHRAGLKNTDVVVSTDSLEIRLVAEKYLDFYAIDRPSIISGDTSPTEAALIHALTEMELKTGLSYDAVITLQPTSPLRKPETLIKFVECYENEFPKYDAMLSLHTDFTDLWVECNGKYERLYKDAPRRRQQRKPVYKENSAYYITDVKALRETESILGHRTNAFIISEEEALDINEWRDLVIAESILSYHEC